MPSIIILLTLATTFIVYTCGYKESNTYTPLNTLQERILKECANTKFKKVRIRNPYPAREFAKTVKSKYWSFRKNQDHNTHDCGTMCL